MADFDDKFVFQLTKAWPGSPLPEFASVQEAIRRLQMDIYKVEGRLGESVIRDDIRILGAVNFEGRQAGQPPISEPNEATIYLPNDGMTGAMISQHGGIYVPLIGSANLDIQGTAGENLTAPCVVYISDGTGGTTDGRWYLTDADDPVKSTDANVIGHVARDAETGNIIRIRVVGRIEERSNLIPGDIYYLSSTPGALTNVAGSRAFAIADTPTSLVILAKGLGGGTGAAGEVLYTNDALIGNVGTGEDNLRGYTVDSTLLFTNGGQFHVIDVSASFRQALNGASKTIRLRVQSTPIATIVTADATLTTVQFRGRFIYSSGSGGAGGLRYHSQFIACSTGGVTHTRQADSDILDGNLDLDLQFTGEATTDSDILQSSMVVTAYTLAA